MRPIPKMMRIRFATVGEISDALRRTFGEYQESVVI